MKIVLGCMEIGRRLSDAESKEMVQRFLQQYNEVDTAYMYSDGKSELMLGQLKDIIVKNKGIIATKVNPYDEGFKPENIIARFRTSLSRLKVDSVDILYLHMPCHTNPLEHTLSAINDLYKEKLFKRFGLSNYAAWQVSDIVSICERNGWVVPSVYQGMYNCLTRGVEKELIPCLRRHNISFYAYNPLAGGLLTGRYNYEDIKKVDDIGNCRFFGVGGTWAKAYRERFWHEDYFKAIDEIRNAKPSDTSLLQISFDWLLHHSKLSYDYNDAIIIGASTMEQFCQNMDAIEKSQPLNADLVNVIASSYSNINGCCPSYFR